MAPEPIRIQGLIRFGEDCELDVRAYELRRRGRARKLERIPMEILLLLVEQRGQLVTREQIAERVWGTGAFLDTDNGINGAVRKVRQALRGNPEDPRFIQTVTGKGYRFIAPVVETPAAEASIEEDAASPEPPASKPQPVPGPVIAGRSRQYWPIYVGTAAILVLALVAWFYRSRAPVRSQASGGRLMLAVLPFVNLTGDAGEEYFSDGLTEEMIAQLGSLDPQHLGVIARTSVMHYKNSEKPLKQIGRELGVQYVLEGSVRRDSNRVRIAAQLIQANDQTHVWAREYDRELTGLLALQGEIAREIATEIQTTLGEEHKLNAARGPATRSDTTSYEAYDLYLKGRYFWNKRTAAGFQQAAEYFQQAIVKDPDYARAYAGLADTFGLMSTWSLVPQNEFMPKARAAALRALALNDTLAEAHTSLALIAENYDYDWATAEKEFQRAIQLNPDYATAHQWYAEYLSWQGRFEEALAESERARQLDPMSLIIASDHGAILYYSRQYDRAIAQCRAVLDMDPNFPRARGFLFTAYVEEGRFMEAQDALAQGHTPADSPWTWAGRAYLYGRWGRTTEAQQALAKFELLAPKLRSDRTVAELYAYGPAGHKDKVIGILRKAYSEHSNAVVALKVDPSYDWLRSDPRFQDLLRQLGLSH